MIARGDASLDRLAHRVFDVLTHITLTLPRNRRRGCQLKETEYHTLSLLQQHGLLSVGELHRLLHVLPAQMSRILRSLETRQPAPILCRINPHDKRKVDVELTAAGEKLLVEYEASRVGILADILSRVPEDQLHDLARLLDTVEAATVQVSSTSTEAPASA